MGFSTGANLVQLYLAEKGKEGSKIPIVASVAISPLHDVGRAVRMLDKNSLLKNSVLFKVQSKYSIWSENPNILKAMQGAKVNHRSFLTHPVNIYNYDKMRHLDREVVCPLLGIDELDDDYYYNISGGYKLQFVRSPLLNICSRYDPIVEYTSNNLVIQQSTDLD